MNIIIMISYLVDIRPLVLNVQDCAVLDMDVSAGRPETLIIRELVVPPGSDICL